MLATYSGRAADLAPWLKNADINRDRNLRLQYLAGMALNAGEGDETHAEIVRLGRLARTGKRRR